MSTYVAATLGCLTALAIAAYAKELRGRMHRREPIFKRKNDRYWDRDDMY